MTAKEYWKDQFDELPKNDAEKLAVVMMQRYAFIREQQAWNAAREVGYSDEGTGSWKYQIINEWREKR
jgi:hypothetical protein